MICFVAGRFNSEPLETHDYDVKLHSLGLLLSQDIVL